MQFKFMSNAISLCGLLKSDVKGEVIKGDKRYKEKMTKKRSKKKLLVIYL